ncbi:MAG: 6-bladed beta-propeller [Bryobacteraceae bacterium]
MPLVFDSKGQYVRTIGRKGSGPGEFVRPNELFMLPGDSVLVLDRGSATASVVGPDYRVRRVTRVPAAFPSIAVVDWPRRVLMNGMIRSAESVGWPLHLVDMSGPEAKVLKSFGLNDGELRPSSARRSGQHLSVSQSGGVWAIDELRYRITEWTQVGTVARTLVRDPHWFRGESSGLRGGRNTAPSPRIAGISQDADGNLWIFALVAAENWQSAWRGRPALMSGEVPASSFPPLDSLYQTKVEVIDPKAGRIVAAGQTPLLILGTIEGGVKAVAHATNADGAPVVSVLGFSLRRR